MGYGHAQREVFEDWLIALLHLTIAEQAKHCCCVHA
jgi:hypothetical protein